jgi:ABC-type polysaccharide/polyol phosphate export permease
MRLRRKPPSVPPADTGWRITPVGIVLVILIVACFVLGGITGGFIFFAAGCFLLLFVAGGFFTSLPNTWRAGGGDDYYGPTGTRVRPPEDD